MNDSLIQSAEELRQEIARNAEELKLLRRMLRVVEDRCRLAQRHNGKSDGGAVEDLKAVPELEVKTEAKAKQRNPALLP